jgi:Domain of unknown function (DUF4464)
MCTCTSAAHSDNTRTHVGTMQELQRREEAVRNGKLATIVFVRDFNAKRQEISGYIDYGARLADGRMDAVFALKQRFLPKASDLSFFNWDTRASATTPTANFQARRRHQLYVAAASALRVRANASVPATITASAATQHGACTPASSRAAQQQHTKALYLAL